MCIESVKKQREKKKQRTCRTGSLGWIFVCTWSDYLVVLCFTIVVVIKEGAQDSVGTAFTVFGDWEITQKGEGN